jgi:hypothetical protein
MRMTEKLPALLPLQEVERMASALVKSQFGGIKTVEQALTLMLVAQAEGMHPATVLQTYHIINGQPSMKSHAMLARFQQAGGSVRWLERSDTRVCGVFSHPQGGEVEVDWDMERVKKAGLANREGYQKYPRPLLTARAISEGVRTVYPAALGGFYTPEEVSDFAPRDVTPATQQPPQRPKGAPPRAKAAPVIDVPPHDPETGEIADPFPPSDDVGVGPKTGELPIGPPQRDPDILQQYEWGWPGTNEDPAVWKAQAAAALASIRKITSPTEMDLWQEANSRGLQRMKTASGPLHEWFGNEMAKHANALDGG